MNHETDDFARFRFTPRVSREHSTSWAVEHYRPEKWRHFHEAMRRVALYGSAALIGALIAKGF